ncbi:hypothetical protein [Salinisphaera sp. T31B1]|uniref:hypothetical protein n=1 Tax=Salinisphaera sp. T31B1 TaxID=727963 RepID=UPI00333E5042
MAGDWIKVEKSLSDKPEAWQIAASLDIDPDAVVGKLIRIWAWFDDQTENGNAPSVTRALLDRRVGVTGFCDAMIAAGWMHDDGQHIALPNFDRHNGKTAKNRALTAKRVAQHKRKSNAEGNETGNAASVTNALPREEKRRSTSKPHADARESDADVPPPAASPDGLSHGEVRDVLMAHGAPFQVCTSQKGQDAINGWVRAAVTGADLAVAVGRAHQRKRDGPISPGYLDPIVKQVVSERTTPKQRDTHGTSNSRHHGNRASERAASLLAIAQGDE